MNAVRGFGGSGAHCDWVCRIAYGSTAVRCTRLTVLQEEVQWVLRLYEGAVAHRMLLLYAQNTFKIDSF